MLLRARDIKKHFGGVKALDGVNLELAPHEVHGLVGENGAGKSTFIKILGGVIRRDSGRLEFNGKPVDFQSPIEAKNHGIAVIHQELSVLPTLTVAENMFMGRMPSRRGLVSWREMAGRTRQLLARVGLNIDPLAEIGGLSISHRQLIEIAKALSFETRLIIMDEPNSSLSAGESERLFELIRQLKREGVNILYISHKLDEVLAVCDRVTVFRDGIYVSTHECAAIDQARLVGDMVGRKLSSVESIPTRTGELLLEVENISGGRFRDVSFSVRRGEVLGFAGLVGAGRSEVARAVFGADQRHSGRVIFKGEEVRFASPRQAMSRGMAMLAEDRKGLSLFMDQSIAFNMSIGYLLKHLRVFVPNGDVAELQERYRRQLGIKMHHPEDRVASLSGGNQQKTVLARWLATKPDLLILDEPTHGVDVGAKAEIYRLVLELASEGMAVILISSEMEEVIALSDRLAVMYRGRLQAILEGDAITEHNIMFHAAGLALEAKGDGA